MLPVSIDALVDEGILVPEGHGVFRTRTLAYPTIPYFGCSSDYVDCDRVTVSTRSSEATDEGIIRVRGEPSWATEVVSRLNHMLCAFVADSRERLNAEP
jgi:hypothetical protein